LRITLDTTERKGKKLSNCVNFVKLKIYELFFSFLMLDIRLSAVKINID